MFLILNYVNVKGRSESDLTIVKHIIVLTYQKHNKNCKPESENYHDVDQVIQMKSCV